VFIYCDEHSYYATIGGPAIAVNSLRQPLATHRTWP
jgi:hypothetical protein